MQEATPTLMNDTPFIKANENINTQKFKYIRIRLLIYS